MSPTEELIPVNAPDIGDLELEFVSDCVKSGWISSAGPYIDRFENAWAQYCEREFGVAVANGTAALQLAIRALGIGPGDEVLIPTFTIVSCALAVIDAGATPVLVDSDPETWGMDVSQLEAGLTPHTRAIMPVHMYGHPVDMDPLLDLAERRGLLVIEDAAEVHGAQYHTRRHAAPRWRPCGAFGDISTFSFYANKIITTGEGGMILTNDSKIAERARSFRNLCFQRSPRFVHEDLGYNFRLTNMQAAIGCAQLTRIQDFLSRKRRMAQAYGARLSVFDQLQLPVQREWAQNVYWMYGVVLSDDVEMDAATFAEKLRIRGVETRPFFRGMHEQPALRKRGLLDSNSYPVAERLARRGLYLPSGLTLTDDQIDRVCAAIEDVLQ